MTVPEKFASTALRDDSPWPLQFGSEPPPLEHTLHRRNSFTRLKQSRKLLNLRRTGLGMTSLQYRRRLPAEGSAAHLTGYMHFTIRG
jgi:hypothetical protein